MTFVHMEAGLMKIVLCLNRSWTRDSYLNRIRRPMVSMGECPDTIWIAIVAFAVVISYCIVHSNFNS